MAWSRIIGHEHWVSVFDQIQRQHRLAHAYLFVGPAGIGKRLFAGELAKALLCEKRGETLAACDHCAACHLVDANTHPDLFLVAKPEDVNEMPIDTMRELTGNFSLKAARGHGKVAILDDADDLNDASANCFLKTLEEPPAGSHLFLIGTSLEGQLPTIRSRCQVIRFSPLSQENLQRVLQANQIQDPAQLARLSRLGEGSPGQALQLADEDLWKARRLLLEGFGQPRIDTIQLSRDFLEFVEEAGKEAPKQRLRAKQVIHLLLGGFKDVLKLTLGGEMPLQSGEDSQWLQALEERLTPEKILMVQDRCLQAETQLDRYLQVGLVLDGLLERLTQIMEAKP